MATKNTASTNANNMNMDMKNYKYGKLVDGSLEYAPYYLLIGTRMYINASATKYLSQGWKQIIQLEYPDDEEEHIAVYTEDATAIYVSWN